MQGSEAGRHTPYNKKRSKGIIFPSFIEQGWQHSGWHHRPSHGQELQDVSCCFTGVEGDLQKHFCRQEVPRACQGSHCFSPGKTDGHLCPAAGTQTHLTLTTSCSGFTSQLGLLHIPMADQPWLYKTQVLKTSEHLKQKVLFLSRF